MRKDEKDIVVIAEETQTIKNTFQYPERVWTRKEILDSPCPVPKKAGIYAGYFRNLPEIVRTDNCVTHKDSTLLYVGISPRRPPQNGKPPSRQRLYHRIKNHLKGNASGSTLRLTLGCILSKELQIQLQEVGKSGRMTFAGGEQMLSEWLNNNAFVVWYECENPWDFETELFTKLSLPLNLKGNENHGFHPILSELRRIAKQTAVRLPNKEAS